MRPVYEGNMLDLILCLLLMCLLLKVPRGLTGMQFPTYLLAQVNHQDDQGQVTPITKPENKLGMDPEDHLHSRIPEVVQLPLVHKITNKGREPNPTYKR